MAVSVSQAFTAFCFVVNSTALFGLNNEFVRCSMLRSLGSLVVLFGIVTLAGCGDPGAAPTAKVDGTVTLDGAPLPKAAVTLNPTGKEGGRPPSGVADASGKFTVSSFKPNDGAMPGSYIATVNGDGVPDKYKTTEKSDLKVTIEANKTNAVKLELKKGE